MQKVKTIKQSAFFKATPAEVYSALMDSRKRAKFTKSAASMSRRVGGKISAYGGYVEGKNLILEPGKKIVQSWRGSDWLEGHFSKVTFRLKKAKNGTRLAFAQTGVPEESYKDISRGWKEYYWRAMKKTFGW